MTNTDWTTASIPNVGVGAIITKGRQLLLMKRRTSLGHQSWSTPGGYLEFAESPAVCAQREAQEEVGYQGASFSFLALTNDIFEGRHFVTIWMISVATESWDARNLSEEVMETGWFTPEALPQPLFSPFSNLVRGESEPARAFGTYF